MTERCPFCGAAADDVPEEIAHMETEHPDVIRERLKAAGIDPPKELDPAALEMRYRALEAELAAFDLGTSFLMLAGLGDRWLNVLTAEVARIVDLRRSHYAEHEEGKPHVIRVGGGKIVDSRDELTAIVAFVQGMTFAEALRRERDGL